MLEAVRAVYRETRKPRDIVWNDYFSRPPAAVLVWLLRPTAVTPNQVTFLGLAVFLGAAALLCLVPTYAGLLGAALVIQLSYILDCVDGQLARLKGLASPVGALLDFLMDEVKALVLVGAAAVRLWRQSGDAGWLLGGIGGLVVAATGIALTSFMRRGEYLSSVGAASEASTEVTMPRGRRSPLVAAVERAGRFVFHYPTYFWALAIADRVNVFFFVYLGTHVLYLGRSGLMVMVRLGRPLPK